MGGRDEGDVLVPSWWALRIVVAVAYAMLGLLTASV